LFPTSTCLVSEYFTWKPNGGFNSFLNKIQNELIGNISTILL
jgi:hypothetical protein